MLKSLSWSVVRLSVLLVLIAQVLFNVNHLALAQDLQSSKTAPAKTEQVEVPRGDRQTTEVKPSASRDDERKSNISPSPSTPSQPGNAYDMEMIEQFNQELYGEGN